MTNTETKQLLSDKWYDSLKFLTTILFPGLGTLYFGISQIWNLGYGAEIVGTITAVTLFMGTLIGISSSSFKANHIDPTPVGTMVVKQYADGAKSIQLVPSEDPEFFDTKDKIVFDVKRVDDTDDTLSVQEIVDRVNKAE